MMMMMVLSRYQLTRIQSHIMCLIMKWSTFITCNLFPAFTVYNTFFYVFIFLFWKLWRKKQLVLICIRKFTSSRFSIALTIALVQHFIALNWCFVTAVILVHVHDFVWSSKANDTYINLGTRAFRATSFYAGWRKN